MTALEILAIIGIVMACCCFIPYFYLAAWATEIACVIRIIASDDNPDYKIPWLLFVLILPIAGFMLYFLFYNRTLQKRFIRRLQMLKDRGIKRNAQAFIYMEYFIIEEGRFWNSILVIDGRIGYDMVPPEDIVVYLYENGICVTEIKTDKIGLEEYYIDLMKGGRS